MSERFEIIVAHTWSVQHDQDSGFWQLVCTIYLNGKPGACTYWNFGTKADAETALARIAR